jgi:hypothetical protein
MPDVKPAQPGRNAWDFGIVFVVIVALLLLTGFVVDHFRQDTEKMGAILGIVVPSLPRSERRSSGSAPAFRRETGSVRLRGNRASKKGSNKLGPTSRRS